MIMRATEQGGVLFDSDLAFAIFIELVQKDKVSSLSVRELATAI